MVFEGDFKTFVTSTGSTCTNGSGFLDSFCYFVYHHSDGELELGNLKGILRTTTTTSRVRPYTLGPKPTDKKTTTSLAFITSLVTTCALAFAKTF